MSKTHHAFDFLEGKVAIESSVIVMFGDELFLKSRVSEQIRNELLSGQDAEINLVKLDGSQATLREIQDELATVSLFGGGQSRVVLVEDADKFVSEQRAKLEALIEHPPSQGVLILDVGPWAKNTKLYKSLDKTGLQIDCRQPLRGKSVDTGKIAKWAAKWGKQKHKIKIKAPVIEYMMELTGTELGVMDQNLAKLALYFEPQSEIPEAAIDEFIGGWQTRTVWQVIDNAINGHTGTALSQLDRLIQNGEDAFALFGRIAWALRRYAMAFEEAQASRRKGKRFDADEIMGKAGFGYEKKKALEQLKKIGREKGATYYRVLLDCDLALKSTHSTPPRARIALEKLIVDLVDQPKSSVASS